MADMADMAAMADMADRADRADMADIADMADRANSKVIFPTIAYIDGKSEIISDSLTDSTNCKKMLSHLKKVEPNVRIPRGEQIRLTVASIFPPLCRLS